MSKSNAVATSSAEVAPPAAPTTSAEWRAFITNLDRSREDAEARLADLLVQRNALALKLRLGSKPARAKADEIDAAADRLKIEIGEMVAAVAGAEEETRKAEKVEKLRVEVEKAGQVQLLLLERAALAKLLDESLSILVAATGHRRSSSIEVWIHLSVAAPHVLWSRAPLEMIATGHLRIRAALPDFPTPRGFQKPGGDTEKTWAGLVPHVDKAAKAWAEGLLPLATMQAAADAHKAAQEGASDAA
jgi:hypothetical protein